jgi:hypothetical protein
MGRARMYVLGFAAVVLVLAALGLMHLISPGTRDSAARPRSDSSREAAVSHDAVLAITEIGSTETKGRNGQPNVAVRIGVAPRPHTKKGEVEIRVLFFDVTPAGEMRPTDAQVDYKWTTPVRDWADPTPKYLVATYAGGGASRKSTARLRYGGFVARVYFDGQLQAERSEPKGLVAALRNGATPSSAPLAMRSQVQITPITPTLVASRLHAAESDSEDSATAPNRVAPLPTPLQVNRESSSAVPYASPVPDKPGFVYSPYNSKFLIDVRGFPPGTEVNDPNTSKPFKVP